MVEVLITMLIVGIVASSLMAVFISLQRSERFTQDRSEALDDMRVAMERMTKEIRQATSIDLTSGDSRIEMDAYVNGTSQHLIYEIVGEQLVRRVGASGTAVVIASDLDVPYPAGETFFAYTFPDSGTVADAVVVSIRLRVHPPRRPDTTLELRSEVRVRNRSRG
jgi:type II secretory pathway pseudopilin PulG